MMLERREYLYFLRDYADNKYPHQRIGQAFYNHFKLHKVADQIQFKNLYELDGDVAKRLIIDIFTFM